MTATTLQVRKGDRVRIAENPALKVASGQTGKVTKVTAKFVYVFLDKDRADHIIAKADEAAYVAKHGRQLEGAQPGVLGVPFYQLEENWAVGVTRNAVVEVLP